MVGETEYLAKYIVSDSCTVLREPGVLEMVQEALLDWIGCTVAGAVDPRVTPLYRLAANYPMPGSAVLAGRRTKAHPMMAALLNGAASHVLELDDVERTAFIHPGIAPISAAFAAFSVEPSTSEKEFLRAIVVGYEVAIRVGRSVNPSHYELWHTSGTAGAFGAAAAAAVILGLDLNETMWALGNAGTEAAGLWQFNLDGALTKPYHIGMASLHGLIAGLTAKEGLTGPHRILEGEQGFLRAMSDAPRPEELVKGLGNDLPAILGISRKRWASCRFTHPPIDAILTLRGNGSISSISRIVIETFETAIRVAGHSNPQTPQESKFSIAYCCALAWIHGTIELDHFDVNHAHQNVDLHELLRRIELVVNPEYDRLLPDSYPTRVTVFYKDGHTSQCETSHPVGDPECPISGVTLRDKVSTLLQFAGWSEDRISSLYNLVQCLGTDNTICQLKLLSELIE